MRLSSLTLICGIVISLMTVITLAQQESTLVKIPDSESRTWKSADKKFSVTGKLVAIKGDKIWIAKDGGAEVSVPLEKLSVDDQTFVQESLEKLDEANPFAEEGVPDAEMPAKANEPVDYSGLSTLSLSSDQTFDPNAGAWKPRDRSKIKPIRIEKSSVHVRQTTVISNSNDSRMLVSFHDPFGGPNAENPKNWVTIIDLANSKVIAKHPLSGEQITAADISEDGKKLLAFGDVSPGKQGLMIFDLTPSGLRLATSWEIDRKAGFFVNAISAKFLAGGYVVSEHFDQLIVWQINPLQARFKVPRQGEWKLADDRRHAIVNSNQSRFELDLVAGQCTGELTSSGKNGEVAEAISADGKRTAKVVANSIKISSGSNELLDEFYAPVNWPNAGIKWFDDRFLVLTVPNRTLYVDSENRVLLAEVYENAQAATENGWQVQSEFTSISISPPAPVAKNEKMDLAKLAKELPATGDDLLLLKPGDKVRLSVKLASNPGQNNAVKKRLTELLKSRQVTIDDAADYELAATSEKKTDTVEYRNFGMPMRFGGSTESVNVTNTSTHLQLRKGDKIVWSISNSYGPSFILHINEGESAQQAADRESRARPDFWESLELPEHIAAHRNGGAWFRFHTNNNRLERIPTN